MNTVKLVFVFIADHVFSASLVKFYAWTGISQIWTFSRFKKLCEYFTMYLISFQVVQAIVMNIFSAFWGVSITCFAIVYAATEQPCRSWSLTATTMQPTYTTWSQEEPSSTSMTTEISAKWNGRETTEFDYGPLINCLVCMQVLP